MLSCRPNHLTTAVFPLPFASYTTSDLHGCGLCVRTITCWCTWAGGGGGRGIAHVSALLPLNATDRPLPGGHQTGCAVDDCGLTNGWTGHYWRKYCISNQRYHEGRVPRMAVTDEPKEKEETKGALTVAVNTENTEFSAGVLGGLAGEFLREGGAPKRWQQQPDNGNFCHVNGNFCQVAAEAAGFFARSHKQQNQRPLSTTRILVHILCAVLKYGVVNTPHLDWYLSCGEPLPVSLPLD